jgi:hypothetical protein
MQTHNRSLRTVHKSISRRCGRSLTLPSAISEASNDQTIVQT